MSARPEFSRKWLALWGIFLLTLGRLPLWGLYSLFFMMGISGTAFVLSWR